MECVPSLPLRPLLLYTSLHPLPSLDLWRKYNTPFSPIQPYYNLFDPSSRISMVSLTRRCFVALHRLQERLGAGCGSRGTCAHRCQHICHERIHGSLTHFLLPLNATFTVPPYSLKRSFPSDALRRKEVARLPWAREGSYSLQRSIPIQNELNTRA
jgi:hypothetical protein